MKRVVLYADDMEPITVLELEDRVMHYLSEVGSVKLAVLSPPQFLHHTSAVSEIERPRIVRIVAEKIRRHGNEHFMLFTHDEESALLLKAAFLPGQRSALQDEQRTAFASGFLNALQRMG
jgi:hypothetical protein